jgi:hypothetical protein
MTTLAEYKDIAAEQALERAVFRWRPHDEGVNPFDEVGPALRMAVLTRVRWHFAYECYLSSRAWRRVRNDALMRAQLRCERCDKGGLLVGLEAHHRTYEHLGDERDDELEALCAECHRRADRERRHTTRRRRWLH